MRKILFFMVTSLDGRFEGKKPWELDWHNVDAEFNEFAIEQLKSVDTILFGRATYEGMASYWTSPQALTDDPIVAGLMNGTPKIVFSRTLEKADWRNTRLVKGDAGGEIKRLKQQPGKDMIILGSSGLAVSLVNQGHIDEYRIMVHPVILGAGKSLFEGLQERRKLKWVNTKAFKSGNQLLYYHPK